MTAVMKMVKPDIGTLETAIKASEESTQIK